MKRLIALCGLMLGGCVVNYAELDALEGILDRHLVQLQEKSRSLIEARRESDVLNLQLEEGLRAFPEFAEEWSASEASAAPVRVPPKFPALPPVSLFEGGEGARKRALIADTQARLLVLTKLVDEAASTADRNARMRRQLESIEQARAARLK
jgi:hypothetical protein